MATRSHYEVLGVGRGATLDEIKAAYKRLTVTHRPSELSPAALRQQRLGGGRRKKPEATCEERQVWLEIQHAFDVLANPRRREPYDRRLQPESQMDEGAAAAACKSDAGAESRTDGEAEGGASADAEPPDFSQLSDEDFLRAAEEYFAKVAAAEPRSQMDSTPVSPSCGGFDSPWERVREFYDFWLNWATGCEFHDAARHGSVEIAAAPNRQVRRLMEAEDDKLRRIARKAYVSRVREAAHQAQRCDPRVRSHREAQQQEAAKEAACRAGEAEAEALRLKRDRATQRRAARLADEERWAELSPELEAQGTPEFQFESSAWTSSAPFACLACSKDFKTRDAWTEHAKAKRHRHNARRWEEAGRGSPLVQHGSQPVSPASCPSLSPAWMVQRSRNLSSPFQLPSAALPDAAETGGLQDMVLPEACVEEDDVELAGASSHPGNFWGEVIEENLPRSRLSTGSSTSACQRPSLQLASAAACPLPAALEVVAALPAPFWIQVLLLLGGGKECIRAVVALLSNSTFRFDTLSEATLWHDLAIQLWGEAIVTGSSSHAEGGPHDFMRLASSLDEACDLWALVNGAAAECRPPRCTAQLTTTAFAPSVLHSAGGLIAAAASGGTEVRLFSQSLARLPPVRTRGKPVEALALAPGGENLAVGSCDGQVSLYSLNDPDEAPTRIHRLGLPQAQTGQAESSQSLQFAGLHFVGPDRLLAAAKGVPGAVLLDVEARGQPIAQSLGPEDKEHAGLLAATPLSGQGGEVMLLLETSGRTLLWDVRAPTCTSLLEFGVDLDTQLTAGIVDVGRWQVVATSPSSLHWGDLRTQVTGVTRLPVEPSLDPPFLAMGSRGAILSLWRQSDGNNQACALASGGASGGVVLAHAGSSSVLPLAASGGAASGSEPFVVSLVIPKSGRNAWDFQLCVIGERRAGELQMVDHRPLCPQRRPAKSACAPAPVIRRLPGRWGPHTGRRRGGR